MGGRGASSSNISTGNSRTEQLRRERSNILRQAQRGYPTETEVRKVLDNLGDRETGKAGNIEIRNYGSFYNIKTPGGYSGGVDLETKGAVIRFLRSTNRLKIMGERGANINNYGGVSNQRRKIINNLTPGQEYSNNKKLYNQTLEKVKKTYKGVGNMEADTIAQSILEENRLKKRR